MNEEWEEMRITACKAEEDYKLWLRFEDGLEGSVFLGNLLEIGAFQLWRDVREFEKVSVDPETATVTWEGGIRLDADILYHDVKATRFSTPARGNLRRRLDKSGAARPGFFSQLLKEYQDGEEKSEEGRQEKEEAESIITKEKEVVKDSW
jgi:hypothetical protein